MKQKCTHFFATGFGSGNSPFAPGTMGTLVAIPPYLLLQRLPLTLYALLIFFAFIVGVWLCDQASKALNAPDHPSIVWDEMVGFWLTMFAIPCTGLSILIGFLAFRWFDIWKPWPIRWIDQKIGGGFGIMLDDMLAAIYANVVLQLIYYFLNG